MFISSSSKWRLEKSIKYILKVFKRRNAKLSRFQALLVSGGKRISFNKIIYSVLTQPDEEKIQAIKEPEE